MAKKAAVECSCVVDTSGLHVIANASANVRAALLAKLQDGTIGVPSWAWQEFRTLYEEEAADISPSIFNRITTSLPITVRAARISEDLQLGFSKGAYDQHVELFSAAVAINRELTVLTSADNLDAYDGLGCLVEDIETWLEGE